MLLVVSCRSVSACCLDELAVSVDLLRVLDVMATKHQDLCQDSIHFEDGFGFASLVPLRAKLTLILSKMFLLLFNYYIQLDLDLVCSRHF